MDNTQFETKENKIQIKDILNQNSWEVGVLPYKRLMGMCRWMGPHFHDRIDYNGVALESIY